MPKFMLICGGVDLDKRSASPGRRPEILESYMAWVQKLTEAGHFVGSYKLFDQTGARLTVRGGQVVDGPFVETKEAIGGVFVVEAASLEQATDLARDCPVLTLQNGYLEVRAVER
ncbi:MAG TPA: YciI family protein [Kofleriaceae bacterium]|nr:YciI family protein [Kofleriaceae bacterium]